MLGMSQRVSRDKTGRQCTWSRYGLTAAAVAGKL